MPDHCLKPPKADAFGGAPDGTRTLAPCSPQAGLEGVKTVARVPGFYGI